ncbi:EF-hand domain-containing protein [Luteibacter aegosomatissinici]|uniref:EF-hand domain-containing protein n=1 Tax=Luteibacter aegosomatissinici TaxID=2911539 RepID=UPI001FFA12CF|nr:EF-hand domain-containing protein [Luteibacter aegosomatissinici]UPG93293.1 EF-hand domain-containing protein [Luteibacter aegosomatissinici]
MQYPRLIVSLAFAGSLAAGAAFAQSAPSPAPQPAAHPQVEASGQSPHASTPGASGESTGAPAYADLDKDGKGITRGQVPKDVEALKQLRAHFGEADLDHNGRLSAAEYNAYVNKSSVPQQN